MPLEVLLYVHIQFARLCISIAIRFSTPQDLTENEPENLRALTLMAIFRNDPKRPEYNSCLKHCFA